MVTCATSCRRKARSTLKHEFAMRYQILEKQREAREAISRALKKADSPLSRRPTLIAKAKPISWHLTELLKELKATSMPNKNVHRVVFYEITRNAIREAIQNPRDHLAGSGERAAGAPRALDYLVGFNLSPLLWKKAAARRCPPAACRVRALRMICEREKRDRARSWRAEYWTTRTRMPRRTSQRFPARLIEYRGTKVEQFTVTNEAQATDVAHGDRSSRGVKARSTRRHRSTRSSASAIRRRRSRPRRCSRRPRASWLRRATHDAPRAAAV